MPNYNFECELCGFARQALVTSEEASGVSFICVSCGGNMRLSGVSHFAILKVKDAGKATPVAKSCGHSHACGCKGVKLEKPNPFAAQIEKARVAENGTQDEE